MQELENKIKDSSNATIIRNHHKLCGREGQDFLKDEISKSDIKRVVVVGCTPRTYEDIIKKGIVESGINEHLVEQVNIREHCDWIHPDGKYGTEKAISLVLAGIARITYAFPVANMDAVLVNNKDVLVIGGGIAGITSALELLKKGFKVHLVERDDKLGGRAYHLDSEKLSEDEVALPKIEELTVNENAIIMVGAEVQEIKGTLGNYHVTIKSKDDEEDKDGKDDKRELVVGAIIIATGSKLFDANRIPEYNFEDEDVIDFFELEKMIANKELKTPSTGSAPKRMNFIQCVGSRDENKGNAHCSLVCCTYAIKQAARIKTLNPETEVYIHYMDLRGPYNGFEELYLEAQRKGVNFIRGRVAEVRRDNGNLSLRTEHIELGDIMDFSTDLVVLAVGQEPSRGTDKLAEMVHMPLDVDGFMGYYNDRFDILDRRGISLAGCAQGPRGVERTISDSKKSAREIASLLKNGIKANGVHSVIDELRCKGCRICEALCPYEAISMKTVKDHITDEVKLVSNVNLAVCQGCGACAMACPGGVPQIIGFSNKEILAQIDELI
jgi:heterodisulfide reductase subunit A